VNVRVEGLTRRFGRTCALDGISFGFDAGQVIGFVGPNGAGKTTTMRILATLDDPTEGDAFIGGRSVTQDAEEVRRVIGYVPDEMPIYPDTTVAEYLDFFARAFGLRGAQRRDAVEGVIEFTGLGALREKPLKALSRGMRQRVSLGRALVHDPALLLLDEPASGLDPRARVELRELLRHLAARGRTVFISSHILTELTEICSAVVIIEKGKLVESGGLHEVAGRRTNARTYAVRPLERFDDLRRLLLERPEARNVRAAGPEILFELEGDDRAAAVLLTELIRHGYPLAEFRPLRAGLEDLFLTVTKGELQ